MSHFNHKGRPGLVGGSLSKNGLQELFLILKGSSKSGNYGHAGRKGLRGGSSSSSFGSALSLSDKAKPLLSNNHRKKLFAEFEEELKAGLNSLGVELKDVEVVTIYGSFASTKKVPGDVDAIVIIKNGKLRSGDTYAARGGKYYHIDKVPNKIRDKGTGITYIDHPQGKDQIRREFEGLGHRALKPIYNTEFDIQIND